MLNTMIHRILKAAFKIKNLLLLGFIFVVTIMTDFYPPFILIGLAGYMYFINQTIKDSAFQNEYSQDQALEEIRKLSQECNSLFDKVRSRIDKKLLTGVKNILNEKNQLIQIFLREKEDLIKQKVISQGLNLVMTYFKTVLEYNDKLNSTSGVNMTKIWDRIKLNTKSLDMMQDREAIEDLKKALEVDKKLLDRLEEDKADVEKLAAKMVYMESLLKTVKHQLTSDEESDELLKDIEKVTNEVSALDSVLEEKREKRQQRL